MAASTRNRNKKKSETGASNPLANPTDSMTKEENASKLPAKKESGEKKVADPSETVPASREVAQVTSQGEAFAPAAATTISAKLDKATTAALDESLAKMKEINAKTAEGARKKKSKTAASKFSSRPLILSEKRRRRMARP